MATIITSKHMSTLAWLAKHYPDLTRNATINPHISRHAISAEDVVIGTIPVYLMQSPREYLTVELHNAHGGDLSTVEGLEQAGAYLKRYTLLDDAELIKLVAVIVDYLASGNPPPPPDGVQEFTDAVVDRVRGRA